jgi:CRP-like cAMP-binding protein
MQNFINRINDFSKLSAEAEHDTFLRIKEMSVKKGEFITREGKVFNRFCYVKKGLAKCYYLTEKERPFIMKFFKENHFLTALDSFISGQPTDSNYVALEDMELFYLDYEDIKYLSGKHHSFETFKSVFLSKGILINMNRIKKNKNNEATELYEMFIRENKDIVQRISLGDIADYIGVSQVTISRIRSKN